MVSDPESERLLADNMSGSGLSDNAVTIDSSSDYSPNKLPHQIATSTSFGQQFGPKHRSLVQQRSSPANMSNKQTKFQTPRVPEEATTTTVSTAAARPTTTTTMNTTNVYSMTAIPKPSLQRSLGVGGGYVDHLTGDGRLDSFGRDSSLGMNGRYATI